MRYSASEKFEIIELVEQSSLSIRRTLAPIGIPRSTFYDWYSRYQEGGIEALVDGKPRPRRIWNKIPDKIETAIVNLALEEPDLSPRELAVNFTDTKGSFVSEATVYRLLKDHGLITSPAFILMKAADRFANPTTAPNQLWQTVTRSARLQRFVSTRPVSISSGVRSMPSTRHPYVRARYRAGPPMPQPTSRTRLSSVSAIRLACSRVVAKPPEWRCSTVARISGVSFCG